MRDVTHRIALRLDRSDWIGFGAVTERLERIDPGLPVRLRRAGNLARLFAHLPAGVLVGSSIRATAHRDESDQPVVDVVSTAAGVANWLRSGAELPPHTDAWLTALPPDRGWQRVDVVPTEVVRDLVRLGADAHVDAANRALGARAATTLLDAPVLTVSGPGVEVELSNRTLNGLVSMGFLVDGGAVLVSVQGRWTRLATARGSAFVANRPDGLRLL